MVLLCCNELLSRIKSITLVLIIYRKGGGSACGQSSGNPESSSSLPVKSKPNSKRTLYHNGKKVRDRYYDKNGYAKKDIDFTNHGNPKEHPRVPYEHI